jgi:hypothetical protein
MEYSIIYKSPLPPLFQRGELMKKSEGPGMKALEPKK